LYSDNRTDLHLYLLTGKATDLILSYLPYLTHTSRYYDLLTLLEMSYLPEIELEQIREVSPVPSRDREG
jgi:hypothetical protein